MKKLWQKFDTAMEELSNQKGFGPNLLFWILLIGFILICVAVIVGIIGAILLIAMTLPWYVLPIFFFFAFVISLIILFNNYGHENSENL